jgi:CRISPR/Cas system-associated exonuclease Cas4 (RecB family)
MNKNWRDSLRELRTLKPDPIFRHSLSFIAVSDIAQQFYCEAKVEQQYTTGAIPSEIKTTGSEIHEEIFAMESVELEKLIKSVEKKPSVIATFPLVATVNKIRILGVPDAIIFNNSRPKWLIELKTTISRNPRMWPDQEVQIRTYGLLLEKMGFDCSNLTLVLIHLRQDNRLDPNEKKAILSEIATSIELDRLREIEFKYGMKISLISHDNFKAEESVLWAQDYWLDVREPIPTKNPSKCKSCVYTETCPYNLLK